MISTYIYRFLGVALIVLTISSMVSAMAAANAVPESSLGEISHSVSVNDLKPSQCSALHLTNLIIASGVISGTAENDLILGSPGADTISGEGGNDCIVGGGGNDTLYGDSGTDVCIGGSGNDILDDSCETKR
jgi:Ca2+-binding RTX toxin-like protein